MARIIHTDTSPDDLPRWDADQVYNGVDVLATREIFDCIAPQLDEVTGATYAFSKALQAPVIEMKCRGIRIDQHRKSEVIDELYDKLDFLERNLDRIVLEGVGMPGFNWRSPADLQTLFYTKLEIPAITRFGRPTVDRGAREKLEQYTIAKSIVAHLNALADIGKKISVLKTSIDPDGRIRTSYNIAGTDTGRFSSSFSEFGTGGNLQNIEESIRPIFIADPGYKWAKCDAKSGESFVVGAIEWNLFNDGRYLEACESGDPHTAVARICWPGLGWTGDLKKDKAIAETLYYRHYTHRFMCKKLGHGSNYGGRPDTLAAQTKLPEAVVKAFQPLYFSAFPAHQEWHEWVPRQLASKGYLTSVGGRRRWFFGRRTDPDTIRAALAYDPQETLARVVNQAMLHVWRHFPDVSIMMHDHDALTFQYPEDQEDEILATLLPALVQPITLRNGRILAIPYDCEVGWNKGHYDERTNPDGLRSYIPGDKGRRRGAETSILDRPVRRRYG